MTVKTFKSRTLEHGEKTIHGKMTRVFPDSAEVYWETGETRVHKLEDLSYPEGAAGTSP